MSNTLEKTASTTKLLTKEKPIIKNSSEDTFETVLFLPEGKNRKGEGGLRTKGYFKKSYDDKPLISVITVVFNGEKYLEETIQSVIDQSYDNVEYIIIDGGSTDGTLDIIKKYEDKIDYWVSEKDNGIYDAMNKGIKLCFGELIGMINADDYYELDALDLIVTEYRKNPHNMIHGSMNIIDNNDKIIFYKKINNKDSLLYKGMIFNHPTIFISKSIYRRNGLFSTEYKIAADWEMMLRLYLNNEKFKNIDNIIANFRLGGASFDTDKSLILEKHNIRKKHNLYKIFDKYYFYDLLKLNIFGKYLSQISILKQRFLK